MESPRCRPRIKIPTDILDNEIIQVELIPIRYGKMFKANFTYKIAKEPRGLDECKVMGIDLGVNNFATIVSTEGTPYIVDGRFLKNQIYFKSKKIAHLQELLTPGQYKSKRINQINEKFKGIQNNFLNHATKFIIDQCVEYDIGTVIVGYSNTFQFKPNMGKKQNQIFSNYAYKQFIEKLETQCEKHDINLIIQEESYTSKSSFLDNDILPVYNPDKKNPKFKFKGRRIKRGLYRTQEGILINADVNAACNIIRKSKQKFDKERLCKWVQTTPIKIKTS